MDPRACRQRLLIRPDGIFGDERLSAALAAMLERPAEEHTLRSLAQAPAMSRSGFALRFMVTLASRR
ncbi:hypothetical protein [Chelativorans sp. M5D2P16]|uniref:hypothetical protein n=1 Tax=Chelativorans sp. M5D2P16 TaxID=3095678 RepID=UPI002ACA75E8|nr:hypothetical protein [Chelativorans sp. M5D2P16]MDZ5698624.1 hypothetical protein [Chelativorans sp. M5D2P16]